jgi:hypothetical protein
MNRLIDSFKISCFSVFKDISFNLKIRLEIYNLRKLTKLDIKIIINIII